MIIRIHVQLEFSDGLHLSPCQFLHRQNASLQDLGASASHGIRHPLARLPGSHLSHPSHLIHPQLLKSLGTPEKYWENLFLTFESFESFERQKSKAAHGQPLEGLPFPAQHCSELAAWKMLRCELHGCPMVSAIYAIYINLCHLCMSICSFSPTKGLRKS